MNKILRAYDNLSNRQGFNASLQHFQSVMDIISDFEEKNNLADIINSLLSSKDLKQGQVASIVSALLADKYNYFSKSSNLTDTIHDFSYIKSELKKLKAFDAVICYHHPELGYLVINPKNPDSWNITNDMRRNEFVTVFIGTFSDNRKESIPRKLAADFIFDLLNGKKVKISDKLSKGSYRYRAYIPYTDEEELEDELEEEYEEESVEESVDIEPGPKKKTAPAAGSGKMTPLYSVPVTNELFHNGNVEAWKRIIQSYNVKNPDLEVHIFYEGERILNIASLFKWGKVKHGSSILFAVAGENIKDVAKLQKYLKQGASPQFEAFLKFPVNTVLNLF
ncbi:MAG: hypothetical protein PQJ61_10585 [Spirochaetales bacterium]|uniref:Uncharacterized protein n=1 Tax=Candidatus Thalassospirochaeta sargassi TaxID=3119039 RepID=A0AAJ1IJ97_9SPIO|nr:hypothetical protein [Spirochaetales bacterium]